MAVAFSGGNQKCSACGETLPAVFFSEGRKWCRTCTSDYNRRHRAACMRHDPVAMKHCGHCHQLLPASQFNMQPVHPTGLQTWCKKCYRELQRQVRVRNAAAPLPPAAQAPIKTCPTCSRAQPRAAFHRAQGRCDGLVAQCKACYSEAPPQRRASRLPPQPPASAAPQQQQQQEPDPSR